MDTSELLRKPQTDGDGTVRGSLDLRVLGVRTASGLNQLDFALVRYRQESPTASLCIDLLKVRVFAYVYPSLLTKPPAQ